MRNPFRNLRLPGRKSRTYRGRSPVAPRRDTSPHRFALSRVERAKPKHEIHIPWKKIGLSLAGASALSGAVYGTAWLVTGDTLRVQQIDVVGSQVVDPHLVARLSKLGGRSMLTADLAAADTAIEKISAVKSATVERMWPQGIRVTIEEHQAWGFWQAAGRVFVIDRDGRVLQHARPAPAGAPTIIDIASPRDLEAGQVGDADTVRLVARLMDDRVFQRAGLTPRSFIFQRDRGLTVIAEDGPEAVFGDSSNYEFKVQAFEQVLRQLQDHNNAGPPQVAEIDLRFGRNVVLR